MSLPDRSNPRADRLAQARRAPRRKRRLVIPRRADLPTLRVAEDPFELWPPSQLRRIVAAAKAILGPAWKDAPGAGAPSPQKDPIDTAAPREEVALDRKEPGSTSGAAAGHASPQAGGHPRRVAPTRRDPEAA